MNDARAAEYGGGGEDASAPSGRAFSVDEKDRDKLVAPACKAMEPLATESVGFDTSGAAPANPRRSLRACKQGRDYGAYPIGTSA